MKSQKTMPRRKTSHARHAALGMRVMAAVEFEPDQPVDAQDADSVPQPIEEWADDDDANRWLHEHRFDGEEHFDIN
jgi:hypothetical protein